MPGASCDPASRITHVCQGSDGKGKGKGKGKTAPKPWWAYRGEKQSEKAAGSSMVGKVDQWGGKYVDGGYTIDGQFFPLPGVDWF